MRPIPRKAPSLPTRRQRTRALAVRHTHRVARVKIHTRLSRPKVQQDFTAESSDEEPLPLAETLVPDRPYSRFVHPLRRLPDRYPTGGYVPRRIILTHPTDSDNREEDVGLTDDPDIGPVE